MAIVRHSPTRKIRNQKSGQLLFLVNFFWSMFRGAAVADNPWESTSLEWTFSSPPARHGFCSREPVVNHGPYEYSVSGAETDFLMQDAAAIPWLYFILMKASPNRLTYASNP